MPNQDFFVNCRPKDNKGKTSHITMYRGDTLAFKVTLSQDGVFLDLTGANFWWTVKEDINDADSDALFRKTVGNGIDIIYPEIGQLLLILEPTETIALQLEESKSFYWDLQYQDSSGQVQTVLIGKLTILLDVTEEQGNVVGAGTLASSGSLVVGPMVAGVNAVADGDGISINEQQSVHVDGATGGTFTLTVEDPNNVGVFETTTPLNWNATALDIETALETDISFIDGVTAAGGPLDTGAVTVEFDGALVTILDIALMTMDVSNLS